MCGWLAGRQGKVVEKADVGYFGFGLDQVLLSYSYYYEKS
jgi:hypothetical protein